MTARLLAFVLWAAAAGAAVFWGLRLFSASPEPPAHAVAAAVPSGGQGDLARLLGSTAAPVERGAPPPPPADSRYRLLGVVAPRPGVSSDVAVAVIAVDDKPARAFRVGAAVGNGFVVQDVQARRVELGPHGAPPQIQLELPPIEEALGRAEGAAGAPPPAPGALRRPAARPAAVRPPAVRPPPAVPPPAAPHVAPPRAAPVEEDDQPEQPAESDAATQ